MPSFYSDEAIAERKARAANREANQRQEKEKSSSKTKEDAAVYEAKMAAERAAIAQSMMNLYRK